MTRTEPIEIVGLKSDGEQIGIGVLQPDDTGGLLALIDRASDRSVHSRFFSANREAAKGYFAQLAATTSGAPRALVARVELDLNRVVCSGTDVVVVDAKIRTGRPSGPDPLALRLA